MNGVDILKSIVSDGMACKYFGGLMSSDRLIFIPSSRVFYICNTDSWEGEGKHWVVINFIQNNVEFFDPIGKAPDACFLKFMKKYRTKIIHNTKRVQPLNTNTCGEYCIFFASFRSRDVKYKNILSYMQKQENVLQYVEDLKTSS